VSWRHGTRSRGKGTFPSNLEEELYKIGGEELLVTGLKRGKKEPMDTRKEIFKGEMAWSRRENGSKALKSRKTKKLTPGCRPEREESLGEFHLRRGKLKDAGGRGRRDTRQREERYN